MSKIKIDKDGNLYLNKAGELIISICKNMQRYCSCECAGWREGISAGSQGQPYIDCCGTYHTCELVEFEDERGKL